MPLSKEKFLQRTLDRIREARAFWHNWRTAARDDYAFVSGDQWQQEDAAILEDQKRPPITFNYSEKMVDAVVGAEVSNRQEVTYRPRSPDDAALAELWNAAAKWCRDEANTEDEESDAFRDMLICGMGWTQTRMSYDSNPDGLIVTDRIDPLEMFSDTAATKPGITDRRYCFREWWVDEHDAAKEWPNATLTTEPNTESNTDTGVIVRGNRYADDTSESDRHKGQVLIIHFECVELEPIYRLADDKGIFEISEETFRRMKRGLDANNIPYARQYKRVYYRAFLAGETLLEAELSPCQTGFTFQAITGKRDRNHNTFYGLTRVMKDPQRWANKWLSQIMHIINSNAKGGLLAEVNAFLDPDKAQEEWAQPDSITVLREGGINKIQQKQMPPFPSGLDKLMEFALGSLPMVTGINLEALGLANREQAGVLEQQRKQAAYGLLAPMFDSLRRYRKEQGRVLLYFIHEFISDGRLIRIGGPEMPQFLPLTKQPNAPTYDIIIDPSPNAPDVKQQTWEALMQLVPSLLKAGMPLPPDLLDYSPLPTALIMKWKQFAAQSSHPDPKMQQAMQQMQQQLAQLQQQNQQLKLDQTNEQATIAQKGKQIAAELMLKKQEVDAQIALDRHQAQAEFDLAEYKLRRELEIKQQQMENDAAIKARAAANSANSSSTNH